MGLFPAFSCHRLLSALHENPSPSCAVINAAPCCLCCVLLAPHRQFPTHYSQPTFASETPSATMQRSRDSLRLVCRVFQAARSGVPSSCQLSSHLVGPQPQAQPLLSLLQQHLLRSLHTASGPRAAAGATQLWAGHARRQLAAGPWLATPRLAAPRRCLHQQQPQRAQQQRLRWDPLRLRRGVATEAKIAVKGQPAPRSKALEGGPCRQRVQLPGSILQFSRGRVRAAASPTSSAAAHSADTYAVHCVSKDLALL